ncbi:Nonribosomal peptide synthetase [Trichinella spiralis]|uniref:Nonribosomal peptide synthetase n=1 Tax=Trichinella spiralis TaxID=6334 RepID=A0ABR3K0U4_TRISP
MSAPLLRPGRAHSVLGQMAPADHDRLQKLPSAALGTPKQWPQLTPVKDGQLTLASRASRACRPISTAYSGKCNTFS